MKGFGVRSAYGDLLRVLMHRPGPELGIVTTENLREFHFDRPVNQQAFLSDYDAMLSSFRQHDVEVLLLHDVLKEDSDSLHYISYRPNMTYTRDLATVFQHGAVLMGPHLKGRWGDQWIIGRALKRLGVPILGSIDSPGYLEGGGVTTIGEDTIAVSLCDRANEAGTCMLRELTLGKEAKYFLEVPLPFGYIHIDGIFMVLDEKLCLIYPDALRVFPCRLYEEGKSEFRHMMFEEFLEQRGFRMIRISKEERNEGHLNVVVTKRSQKAVGFNTAIRVAEEMKRYGWELSMFPCEELFQGNGGAHCMTCPLLVR